jgi:hypothetical protein
MTSDMILINDEITQKITFLRAPLLLELASKGKV